MKTRRSSAVAVMTAALVTMGGAAALASPAYQGSDVSYVIEQNHKAKICDEESDGRQAYVEYTNGRYELEQIRDQDGAGGSCWQNQWDVSSGILDHQTCESINNWPDACGKVSQHY